jgi:hypothetical protein
LLEFAAFDVGAAAVVAVVARTLTVPADFVVAAAAAAIARVIAVLCIVSFVDENWQKDNLRERASCFEQPLRQATPHPES